MDRRFLTVLGASLAFAVVISLVFYEVVAGARKRGPQASRAALEDVVIAARGLSPGSVLGAADLKLAKVPADQFPKGGFKKIEEALGRPVGSSILADEPVREGRLGARGSGLGLGAVIPNGMRAVSVRVNDVVGVAGFVLPGMRVDVLVTGHPPRQEGSVTKTILQDILVLSAGKNIEPDTRGQPVNVPVVTVLVTPGQAETLTLASEWRIQLVLRNSGDRVIEQTPGRALDEILGRAAAPPAAVSRPRAAAVAPPPPPPAPKVTEEVMVIRGTEKTVEQVRVKTP
jgi:pilus assembly protein CpaB